jgi:hypothetical protein
MYNSGLYQKVKDALIVSPYHADFDEMSAPTPPFLNDFLLLDNTNFLLLDGSAFNLLGAF